MSNTIFGSGFSILNLSNSLLENGRAINARNGGPGLSASSRGLLESFYNGGTQLFNVLYAGAETQEAANKVQILALRAKNQSKVIPSLLEKPTVPPSTTTGTQVDTNA